MLLEDIKNIKQMEAVKKHNLDLSQFNSKEELSKYLINISKRKYYLKNKDRFKEYYIKNADVINARNKERRKKLKNIKQEIKVVEVVEVVE